MLHKCGHTKLYTLPFSDKLSLWRLDGWNKVGSTFSNKANLWQSTEDWYFKNYFDDGSMIYIGNATTDKVGSL